MFDTLILSSGGTRGFATLGALVALEERGLLQTIQHHVGCSVGSLIALFLNIGMSASEVTRLFFKTDFKALQNPSVLSLIDFGLDNGRLMELKIREILAKRGLPPSLTMKDLYAVTGRTFSVGAVNVKRRQFVLLDHTTYPNASVVSCVRASFSIPFVYTPVKIQGHYFVDGALLNHLPIVPWIERFPDAKMVCVELGISKPSTEESGFQSLSDYGLHVMECFTSQQIVHSVPATQCTVIQVDTPSELSWIVSPNDIEKRRLFIIGYGKALETDLLQPPVATSPPSSHPQESPKSCFDAT